jgi:subtilase family serine protease
MLDRYRTFATESGPGPRDVVDYGVGRLWRRGIDGAGTTVAVMEGWDDPGIARYVATSDQRLGGLPDPRITTIFPSGDHRLPRTCPPAMATLGAYAGCRSWPVEIELDVMAVHLMAPYARIVIAVTPPDSEITDDAAANVAPPEIMKGVETISRRHLADVVSISDGSGEDDYRHGRTEVTAQDPGELTAAAAGIPVVVATGDCGATQAYPVADGRCATAPETSVWSDSPWTLAVGGSLTDLSATGRRLGSDPLWPHAGAGLSTIFPRPGYQAGVASITHSAMRSVPDITMDAEQGTSIAAPLMAGVLSLATQADGGRDLGPINTALYDRLGPRGAADGIVDVVRGSDPITGAGGSMLSPGFTAHRGFDVASGWGTISAPRFVPALVRATRALGQERTARARAAESLAVLRRAMRLRPARVGDGGVSRLVATGFLPFHPVVVSVSGHRVAELHADRRGDVEATIDPARLHLPAGTHVVALRSMLITVTGRLVTG